MSYIGNGLTTQSFTGGMDSFNGNASNTVFGLSRTLNTAYDVDVYVENVWQRPGVGYDVSANTITFSSAPSSGSNNVVVVYRNFTATTLQPADGSVSTRNLSTITNINAGTNAGLTLQANNATVLTANATGAVVFATNTATFGTAVVLAANGNFYHYPAAGGRLQIGDFANSSNYHELWLQGSDDLVSTGVQVVRRSVVAGGSYAGNNLIRLTAGGIVYGTDNFKLTSYDTVNNYNARVTVDGNGQVGVGVTPNTSWSSSTKTIAVGNTGAAILNKSNADLELTQNGLWTGSGWQYQSTSNAALYQIATGRHIFYSANSGSAGASVSWNSVMTVGGGGYSVALQGATPQTGTGITFPASQNASSDANTLDDYEEGTWTPDLVASGYTFSWTTRQASYVKIGRMVAIKVYMYGPQPSGSGSPNVYLTLPFQASSQGSSYTGFNMNPETGSAFFSRVPSFRGIPGSNQLILFMGWIGSAATATFNLSTIGSFEWEISGFYFVD